MSKEIKSHSPLVHRTTQRLRMDYDTIRFVTGIKEKQHVLWLQAAMKPVPELWILQAGSVISKKMTRLEISVNTKKSIFAA